MGVTVLFIRVQRQGQAMRLVVQLQVEGGGKQLLLAKLPAKLPLGPAGSACTGHSQVQRSDLSSSGQPSRPVVQLLRVG